MRTRTRGSLVVASVAVLAMTAAACGGSTIDPLRIPIENGFRFALVVTIAPFPVLLHDR